MKLHKATTDNKASMLITPLLLAKKQRGATLFTALVFLMLMTIVSVSATKISMLDILVSGNNEQHMRIFQTTENDLNELVTPAILLPVLQTEGFGAPWKHELPGKSLKPHTDEEIISRNLEYDCGGFDGKAVSLGPDVPPCYLYDFKVESSLSNSGIQDKHVRGAGKEYPNISRNSSLR